MPKNPNRYTFLGRNLTRTKRMEYERLVTNSAYLQEEDYFDYHVQSVVPEAWDTLEMDIDVEEPKEKITLRLDRSVAKFYRAMGNGYQARINRILATFAQMRICQIRRLEEMMGKEMAEINAQRWPTNRN